MNKDYYEKCPLFLFPNSVWRQFKGVTIGGKWKIFNRTMRSTKLLREWLTENDFVDVYQTAACFLDPTRLGPKSYKNYRAGWQWNNNIFLWRDLVIDCDEGMEELPKVIDFLKEKGFTEFYTILTNRGFQTWNLQWKEEILENNKYENVFDKKEYFRRKLEDILLEMLFRGIKVDFYTNRDIHRIYRVPFSLTSKGNVCVLIPSQKLEARSEPSLEFTYGNDGLLNHVIRRAGMLREAQSAVYETTTPLQL